MPLNVLPTMIGSPPSGSRAPRWMLDSAAGAPAVPPLGAEHDEVQRVHRLDLLPGPPAPAGRVRRVERLDHDALVPGASACSSSAAASSADGRSTPGHPVRAGDPVQRVQPRAQRLVDQVGAVEVQAVEEERAEQQLVRRPAPNRLIVSWNGRGRPSSLQREGLAVEHHAPARQAAHQLDQLGHARR